MFLHSGASLHGHEYSNRPSSTIQSISSLRAPLLWSALAPAKQRLRSLDGTISPVIRQRPASDYIPREPSNIVRFREPEDDPPPTPVPHEDLISESELSEAALSLDGAVAAQPVAARSAQRHRRDRVRRKSTTYVLGYPAPRIIGRTKVVQKVLMPRLLLQLQRVSENGRSCPTLEVFPASRIAGPLVAPRLSKRFPAISGVKRHLAYDDLVLVRRDDSDLASHSGDSENEENFEQRNLVAVYSPSKHSEEAEIVLDDGSVWVARPLANGSYDFVHADAEGNTTTARWARRYTPAVSPTTSVSTEASTPSTAGPQTRYTFSIINPLTRRHPVMATLTPSTLDIRDTYTSVSYSRHPPVTRLGRSLSVASSSPSLAPNSPSRQCSLGSAADCASDPGVSMDPGSAKRSVHQIDDSTKMLITVTALWVALRSGWSEGYTPSSSSSSSPSSSGTHDCAAVPAAVCPRLCRKRRHTWTRTSTSDVPRPSEIAAGDLSRPASRKRHSTPLQQHLHHHYAPMDSNNGDKDKEKPFDHVPVPSLTPTGSRTPTPASLDLATGARPSRRRAASTGAAFMQRHLQAAAAAASLPCPSPYAAEGSGAGERLDSGSAAAAAGVAGVNSRARDEAEKGVAVCRSVCVNGAGNGGEGVGMCQRRTAPRQGAERTDAGVERKNGRVRSRLARWMQKLGSR
ncbi:hypothetical protein VTK56DRAFT_8438 [Thermocarpiscus australiensis]